MPPDSRQLPRLSSGDRVVVEVEGSVFDGLRGRIVEVEQHGRLAARHFKVTLDEPPEDWRLGTPWFTAAEVQRAS